MKIELEMSEPRLDEHWVSFEGLPTYAVSNYGRVMNLRRNTDLVQKTDKDGFQRVHLYRRGKRYSVYVHLLVAQAFFVDYKAGLKVSFINGDKQDCSILNLTLKAIRR